MKPSWGLRICARAPVFFSALGCLSTGTQQVKIGNIRIETTVETRHAGWNIELWMMSGCIIVV